MVSCGGRGSVGGGRGEPRDTHAHPRLLDVDLRWLRTPGCTRRGALSWVAVHRYVVTAGVRSATDGHASMVASESVCGDRSISMHVWRLGYDGAALVDGNAASYVMQDQCRRRCKRLCAEAAVSNGAAEWTSEEDQALTAGLASSASPQALFELLMGNAQLAARGKAGHSRADPPHVTASYTSAVAACTLKMRTLLLVHRL